MRERKLFGRALKEWRGRAQASKYGQLLPNYVNCNERVQRPLSGCLGGVGDGEEVAFGDSWAVATDAARLQSVWGQGAIGCGSFRIQAWCCHQLVLVIISLFMSEGEHGRAVLCAMR